MIAGALLGAVALSGCGTPPDNGPGSMMHPPDVGKGAGGELRVLVMQACDTTYNRNPRILTNATSNNQLKTMYSGVELGPQTGNEGYLFQVAGTLGGQGTNLRARARDISDNRAKGGGNASQGPFWRAYRQGMTRGRWRIINVSLSGQIIAYYFNGNVAGTLESCVAARTLTKVTWRHDVTGVLDVREDEFEYHLFGNFKVQPRDNNDENDLFDSSVTGIKITRAMADHGGVIRRHKLWDHITATGSTLRVRLARKKNRGGNWHDLPASHPVYELGDEGCFDMLFRDFPPEWLTINPPLYCLGRCKVPPLINTGY